MAYPFVQAKHYRVGGNLPVDRLVVHSMEAPEKGDTAEAVANYFARGTVVASAHYCIDANSTVQCVHDGDTAYHAPPNRYSIGLEHAGYARQSAAEWADPYSESMLRRSAMLAAELCTWYEIPIRFVPAADLLLGVRGITTHAEVSKAWHQSSHTDPGPHFPMAHYLNLILEASGPPPPAPPTEVTGMKITAGSIDVSMDDKGRGWTSVPSPINRLMFVGAQGSAPTDDGYWPPVTWNVNDRGDVTIVSVAGAPHQSTIIYWKSLIEG